MYLRMNWRRNREEGYQNLQGRERRELRVCINICLWARCGNEYLKFQLLKRWRSGGFWFERSLCKKVSETLSQQNKLIMVVHICNSSYVGTLEDLRPRPAPGKSVKLSQKKKTKKLKVKRAGVRLRW
jgi:hypothetical protein